MRKNRFWFVFLAIIMAGTALVFFRQDRRSSESGSPKATVAQSVAPTPTAAPSVKAPPTTVPPKADRASVAAASTPPVALKIEEFLASIYGGQWSADRTAEGKAFRISGSVAAGMGKSVATALLLAGQVASYLGVEPSQIPLEAKLEESTLSKSYFVTQVSQGFEVYDGSLSLMARKSDDGVFMINNNLVPSVHAVDTTPRISQVEAESILQQKYVGRDARVLVRRGPVVWALSSNQELAWVFNIAVGLPNTDALEVLVGAQSSQVIHEHSTLKH